MKYSKKKIDTGVVLHGEAIIQNLPSRVRWVKRDGLKKIAPGTDPILQFFDVKDFEHIPQPDLSLRI